MGKPIDSYNRNGTVSFRASLHTCLPSGKKMHIPNQCSITRGKKWHKKPIFSLDTTLHLLLPHAPLVQQTLVKSPGKTNTALQSTLKTSAPGTGDPSMHSLRGINGHLLSFFNFNAFIGRTGRVVLKLARDPQRNFHLLLKGAVFSRKSSDGDRSSHAHPNPCNRHTAITKEV